MFTNRYTLSILCFLLIYSSYCYLIVFASAFSASECLFQAIVRPLIKHSCSSQNSSKNGTDTLFEFAPFCDSTVFVKKLVASPPVSTHTKTSCQPILSRQNVAVLLRAPFILSYMHVCPSSDWPYWHNSHYHITLVRLLHSLIVQIVAS